MFGKTEDKCKKCPYHLGMIKTVIDPKTGIVKKCAVGEYPKSVINRYQAA